MPVNNVVLVTTFLQSVGAAPANYLPICAIPADNGDAPFAEAAKQYASVTEMLDDGWLATDDAVLSAGEVFRTGFTPTVPTRIVIVNRAVPVPQVDQFDVLVAINGDYKLFISILGGSPVEAASFTAVASTTTLIKDGLISSFNLGPFAPTQTAVTSGVSTGDVTADVAGAPFILTATGPNGAVDIDVSSITPNSGLYEDLDAAWAVTPFWAVIPDPAEATGTKYEASRWAEASAAQLSTRRNVAILQHNDGDVRTATEPNFASELVLLNRFRTFPLYHLNLVDKMSAAWFGLYGGQNPGSRAWHFRPVGGSSVTAGYPFTNTEGNNMAAQRTAWVERDADAAIAALRVYATGPGSGGFFIVQKQAEDTWWLRITAAMIGVMESLAGINLDDFGISTLVAAIDVVNADLGSGDIPILDLAETTVVPVPLEDVPPGELALGDYQTTGGIDVSTVLIAKGRRVRVSGTFKTA